MSTASIPVDLLNPGQVFACLGFLEAADVLLGDAEGGFDWQQEGSVTFTLGARGKKSPIQAVLEFLADAEVEVVRPKGVVGPWPTRSIPSEVFPAPLKELLTSNGKAYTQNALPIALSDGSKRLFIASWLEGDGRESLKLFAGNQVGAQLAVNMLKGNGAAIGLQQLLPAIQEDNFRHPLDIVGPIAGRFGYDARGAWDAVHVGMSLDRQGILVQSSPLVEILAAAGLEHARPTFLSRYDIRYSAWKCVLPVPLARAALSMAQVLLPRGQYRIFRAHLGNDQQYKKCFPAQEEP